MRASRTRGIQAGRPLVDRLCLLGCAARVPDYSAPLRGSALRATSAGGRGGRAVEGARLESVYAGNRIAGSNPAPSAIYTTRLSRSHNQRVNYFQNCVGPHKNPHYGPRHSVPITASEDERKAFEYVGAYLFRFAKMEDELNSAIERVFNLSAPAAAILFSTLDLFKKLNVIQAAVLAHFSDAQGRQISEAKGSEFKNLFRDLMRINDERVIVAHAPFRPDKNEGVIFDRVSAKGSLKRESLRWDYASFDGRLTNIEELAARLKTFVDSLTSYEPKLDFSDGRNSPYVALLF